MIKGTRKASWVFAKAGDILGGWRIKEDVRVSRDYVLAECIKCLGVHSRLAVGLPNSGGCRSCANREGCEYNYFGLSEKEKAFLKRRHLGIMYRYLTIGYRNHPLFTCKGGGVFKEWFTLVGFIKGCMNIPGWKDTKLQIDRIDNLKGYEPGNIRFVSIVENMRNRRCTLKTAEGETLGEYCTRTRIPYKTAYFRLKTGKL